MGKIILNGIEYTGGGGASSLVGLTDVDISSPSDGQVLVYDANSSKWVNGRPLNVFSLVEEIVIGTWVDLKPIYQKTFQITTPANQNVIEQVQDVSSLNIDTVVNLFGHYKDTNINWGLNIYFSASRSSNVFINGAKTYISMLVNDNVALNKTAYVTAQYTKTTD